MIWRRRWKRSWAAVQFEHRRDHPAGSFGPGRPGHPSALQDVLDGEGGEKGDAAMDARTRALGILDEAGEIDEAKVQDLPKRTGIGG